MVLEGNALFVESDRSQIQAFDAETGRPLWSEAKQIGNPDRACFPMAVNHSLVAAVNGSHLYVLNRFTGETLWDKSMEDGAGAGPTLGDQHVFVPLGNGKVLAYHLKPIVNPLKELGKNGDAGREQGRGRQRRIFGRETEAFPGIVGPCRSAVGWCHSGAGGDGGDKRRRKSIFRG